jgi:aspartate carbamoyltransferase regulatory subunit
MRDRSVTIAKIEKGIVVDHIPAGKALLITQVLGLNRLAADTGDIIAIGINFDSASMKAKDVIKVENLSLTRDMLNVVALIAPMATITRIEDGKVIEKHKVEIPSWVGDVVICPDRFCITKVEDVAGKFQVVEHEPLTLRCNYCETEFFGPLIRYKEKTR